METGTEVTVAPERAVDARLATFGSLMDADKVSASDVLMPVMRLMQPTSTLVTSEKARPGEWRGTLAENLLAAKEKSVEIIAFGFHKTWVVYKMPPGKNQREFVKVEPCLVRPAREREEMFDGIKYLNFETINYIVVPVAEALEGTMIPYLLRLNSTAYIAGKKMESFRLKLQMAQKPHCFSTFKLGAVFKENDKGKYYVPTVDWGRDTTEQELEAMLPWIELAKAGRVRADESDLHQSEEGAPSAGGPPPAPPPTEPPPGHPARSRNDF